MPLEHVSRICRSSILYWLQVYATQIKRHNCYTVLYFVSKSLSMDLGLVQIWLGLTSHISVVPGTRLWQLAACLITAQSLLKYTEYIQVIFKLNIKYILTQNIIRRHGDVRYIKYFVTLHGISNAIEALAIKLQCWGTLSLKANFFYYLDDEQVCPNFMKLKI